MTHFLQSLDQWALQILMVIYNLLGVQDLPKEPNPHWQVIERWAPQPDGHYRLVLESTTIQDECRSGRAKYIIFPQTYMAKQEVYADNIRVYTNEMDKEWYLRSFLDRPVVSCDLILNSKKIKINTYGYIQYFSTINEWPKLVERYPQTQVFYNLVYIVVGILSALISSIFFVITFFLKERKYQVLFMGTSIYFLMFSHYPGYAIAGHVGIMHQISMLTIACLGYVILFEKKVENIFDWMNLVFVIILLIQFFTSWNKFNTIQFWILINALCAILLILLNAFSSKNNFEEKIIFFVTFVLGFRDLYKSQVLRDGFLNLSLLCLALILIMTYRIVRKIYNKNINYIINEEKIINDIKALEKARDVNAKIKQVLHDIKSPITSLNFLLSASENITKNQVRIPLERLNYLVSGEVINGEILTDWYSSNILLECLRSVEREKSYINGKIYQFYNLDNDFLVFFNPDYIKVLFAELVDNSIKNNFDNFLKIEIKISFNGLLQVEYIDDGVGIAQDNYGKVGKFGFSTKGTGLGLSNISERVSSWGGVFSIVQVKSGFKCTLALPIKQL